KAAVVEFAAFGPAVVVEFFDRRLDQAQAAVIAVELLIAQEIGNAVKAREIAVRGDDFKMGAFPQPHGGGEVADNEGDGLAEVSVGRISNQPGPRICLCGDDHGSGLAKRWFPVTDSADA